MKNKEGIKKLPVGLVPKGIWEADRLNEIKEAIFRYGKEEHEVPLQWVEEFNQIVSSRELRNIKTIKEVIELCRLDAVRLAKENFHRKDNDTNVQKQALYEYTSVLLQWVLGDERLAFKELFDFALRNVITENEKESK